MFGKILHANDGSEHAFHALSLALALAKQNNSELHMISAEEIDYMPAFIEEVREETGTAARPVMPLSRLHACAGKRAYRATGFGVKWPAVSAGGAASATSRPAPGTARAA